MSPPVQSPEPPRRLAPTFRNVVAAYAGAFLEAIVFLVLTPLLLRELGLAVYGIWSLALVLAGWLQLLDLGVREAVVKYSAEHQARSELGGIRGIVDAALLFYCLSGLVALAIGAGVIGLGLPHMVRDASELGLARTVLGMLIISAALSLPGGVTRSLLEGLSRFDLINLLRVAHAVLRLGLIILALEIGAGLVGVAVASVTAQIGFLTANWVTVWRLDPTVVPRPAWSPAVRRRLFHFGTWNTLRQVTELAVEKMYEPILALLAGLPSVGSFHLARRIASITVEVTVPLAQVIFPLSSGLEASGKSGALREMLVTGTRASASVALPFCLVLGLGAEPIHSLWLGGRAPETIPLIRAFSAVFFLVATVLPAEAILLGLGRVRLLALIGLLQAAMIVGIGVPLTLEIGALGLALAALASIGVVQSAVEITLAARHCGVRLSSLWRRALFAPLAIGALVGSLAGLVQRVLPLTAPLPFLLWAAGTGAAYALLMWRLGMDRDERALLRSQLGVLLRGSSPRRSPDEPG